MQIAIGTRRLVIDEAVRMYIDRRLHFALARFGSHIAKVKVRFVDANGHRCGVDKQCHVTIALRPSGQIDIEDLDADIRTVIDRVADRAARAVDRNLHRRRDASRARRDPGAVT